ncbi:hypothetical protein Tco_0063843, partial [Tanacetum coccineum]
MKKNMEIVPDDEVAIDAIPLATKLSIIVDWKIIKEGKMGYFQIIRANGSSKRYSSMIQMLQNTNREDLETLWKLVKDEDCLSRLLTGHIYFLEDIDSESAHMVAASKVPMLKPKNGNFAPKTPVVEGVEKVIPRTTIEEKAQKRLEVK